MLDRQRVGREANPSAAVLDNFEADIASGRGLSLRGFGDAPHPPIGQVREFGQVMN
jgi:hypothetical protein